ncbi:hypothetical protein Hypma_005465 [Hypsizygus marmoreus]|uniref:Uncharacterized protein n=1 Tax=Hypsizygus marmoreus TaxID=39966 RepID=A0A369IZ92_HYPMA|nr:hypothetical protein Hypma_005465 [Hypsizygus marmoreus]
MTHLSHLPFNGERIRCPAELSLPFDIRYDLTASPTFARLPTEDLFVGFARPQLRESWILSMGFLRPNSYEQAPDLLTGYPQHLRVTHVHGIELSHKFEKSQVVRAAVGSPINESMSPHIHDDVLTLEFEMFRFMLQLKISKNLGLWGHFGLVGIE